METLREISGRPHNLFELLPHAHLKISHVTVSSTCLRLLAQRSGADLDAIAPADRDEEAFAHFFNVDKARALRPNATLHLSSFRTDGVAISLLFKPPPSMSSPLCQTLPVGNMVMLPPGLYDCTTDAGLVAVRELLGGKTPAG